MVRPTRHPVRPRPGVDFVEEVGWVSVAPVGRGWAASFYPDPKHIAVYVDMTTPAVWQRRAGSASAGPAPSGR